MNHKEVYSSESISERPLEFSTLTESHTRESQPNQRF